MTTPNTRHQYVVVRFVRSPNGLIHPNIVSASVDYDSAQAYCKERNEKREPHESFILMSRHDYELEYGENQEQ